MAKVSELDNESLLRNIKKYKKSLDALYSERNKRLEKNPEYKEQLLTEEELEEIKEEFIKEKEEENNRTSTYHISFGTKTISSQKAFDSSEGEGEESATKILNFSPEELAKYNEKGEIKKKKKSSKK